MKKPHRLDYLVVGLGNPGKDHHFSRHSAGALAARILRASMSEATDFRREKEFLIAFGKVGEAGIAMVMPRLAMNASGRVVAELMSTLGLTPGQTLVLHDEADFRMGKIQVTKDRGSGGHRGIDSVIRSVGTDAFCRVRIGIDRPSNDSVSMTIHVLEQIRGEERRELVRSAAFAARTCLYMFAHGGVDATLGTINQRNTERTIRSAAQEHEASDFAAAQQTQVTHTTKRRLRALRHKVWSRVATVGMHAWRRIVPARVVAVTGSFGKTTTKDVLARLLQELGPTSATSGSFNVDWGLVRTLTALRWRHRFAVVELGTESPGQLAKAARLVAPDIGVVTWVGGAHTDAFASLDAIAHEKAMLVRKIPKQGLVVLNADDTRVEAMRKLTQAKVVTFGRSEHADFRILDPTARWPDRLQFKLAYRDEIVGVQTRMVGTQWAHAFAAAMAVARECGLPLERAAIAAGSVEPHEARLHPVTLPNGAVFLRDEMDPSIGSARVAFAMLSEARTEGRRIVVASPLKDIGLPHAKQDRQLAIEAAACADVVIFIDHAESLRTKIATAMEAGLPRERVRGFGTVQEVADFLRGELRRGDLVLLKGRTSDHLTRIVFAQTGTVACWIRECTLREVCDRCDKLGYVPAQPLAAEQRRPAVQ